LPRLVKDELRPSYWGGGVGDFQGVAHGRGPSYSECGFDAGMFNR
jgi:hypothetical protein